MKKLFLYSMIAGILGMVTSCKKTPDEPPVTPGTARVYSVSELKAIANGTNTSQKRFTSEVNFIGVVVADQVSGNFYKEVYVRDRYNTGGIHLKFSSSACYVFIGDSVRLNLKGYDVGLEDGMLEIDSIDCEKHLTKFASGASPQPKTISLSNGNYSDYLCDLIKIDGVKFSSGAAGISYADATGSGNRNIEDCDSYTLTVRTSNFANFATEKTPTGFGSITGVATAYSTTNQLVIRNTSEVQMNGTVNCSAPTYTIGTPVSSINESFNSVTHNGVFSQTGWLNINEVGTTKWKGDVNAGNGTIRASAYNSGNPSNTMWVITPPVVYTSTMTLTFKSGYGFWDSGHPNALMAYVSTDFNGSNFSTANWTAITSATYANGTGGFYTGTGGLYSSGIINLNSISILNGYSGNFFVAWKHYGNTTYNSNIHLDDVVIQ